ncbi:MAG: FdhF/YdeP family oxidoreductase [Planctomycetota bacterium]|nr:FdhF/YdeP family oxidoreductase [Planctomycetota bacterium]
MSRPENGSDSTGEAAHAVGAGPNRGLPASIREAHGPAAGWGAAKSVGLTLVKEGTAIAGTQAVFTMNHAGVGFDCPGCAWPDDNRGLHMDVCENGIKHAAWEMTAKRADRDFFAEHTVAELSRWSDFALEDAGRLTEPLSYDADSDTYRPITWDDAFALIGSTLRGLEDPDQAAFYTSGRLSNEGSFLYQWFAREFGTNNLPDCSNMCHEASGRALFASIGTRKGTVTIDDWRAADAVFLLGSNAASNAPRMLTALAEAGRRGAQIVHVNPLIEAASKGTIIPHDLLDMALLRSTPTSTLDVQVRIGGDCAFMRGVAKALFEIAKSDPDAIDRTFIDQYTTGFEAYRKACVDTSWDEIERQSGVSVATIRRAAAIYRGANATIASWCLGISQQEHAVDAIREIMNVLLLRGNIGRPGAGPCPIRGHSNVQGNRTCGIDHHPSAARLDRIARACGIDAPRKPGLGTVDTIEAMHRGDVRVFVGMGGNFAAATPDLAYVHDALRRCDLTVQVSTKLNRSHLVHGRRALILPCLGRTELDLRGDGPQSISVEDSMSMVHLSAGRREPASRSLRSEIAIIAGGARATLLDSKTPWDAYADNYDLIRDVMADGLEGFENFNERVRAPLGFRLAQPARERVFVTATGRANFSFAALPDTLPAAGRLMLATVRSHDQWNTTVYSDDDRYRGITNLRTLLFMNHDDMRARGLATFDLIDVESIAKDGSRRRVRGFQAVEYNVPAGCAVGYMPELNVLCPIGDFSPQSDQPMMKQVVVEVERARPADAGDRNGDYEST